MLLRSTAFKAVIQFHSLEGCATAPVSPSTLYFFDCALDLVTSLRDARWMALRRGSLSRSARADRLAQAIVPCQGMPRFERGAKAAFEQTPAIRSTCAAPHAP